MTKFFAAAAATLLLAPVSAFAQDAEPAHDFAGPRIEARLGYETPTISDGSGSIWKIGSAVSYGGEVGVDIRAGNKVVVGPYANYEFSSVSLCDGAVCLNETGNLSAGGRLGFVVGSKSLVYLKAGYASITLEAKAGSVTDSESKGGVQGAIGFEMGIGKKAYAFLEGSYADYGDFYGINLQRRHVAGGVGIRF
ncbi:outer membrane beta-barrel protein [Sphingomonas sp. R-74633]|uniref:outer membrane protein n=1 Tax=Sphingomonas sp. R-74633 TaxID=2751188 RepID=UPI0015D1D75C|nr:outer membrane beta-barrel protein [Sphingomonas sp. R-74633]NYT41349.1 outer membrane beta-barrel protein [Sphingomonas sp. R-74633]